jgi:zinc/manganese transport system substrate-binding protein
MVFRRTRAAWFLLFILTSFLLSACETTALGATSSDGKIQIVAAENFYGDMAQQIGGDHVEVSSILSDPNVDPHSYESNVNQVKAIARAKIVIANGGGYDDWMDNLLESTGTTDRTVIKGFDIATIKLLANEHVWYNPENAKTIAAEIAKTLKTIDAAHAADYTKNLQTFDAAVGKVEQKIAEIKARYAHTPVGLTETIFLYQTSLMDLNVLTPFAFQKALAEGNDPPANSVITTANQVNQHQIKVLIYNQQTQSAVTNTLQSDARQQSIPVIPVTETMPVDKTYQSWMLAQLDALEQALSTTK